MVGVMWRVLWRMWFGVRWTVAAAVLALLLRNSTTQFGEPYYALAAQIADTHFDYIGWELGAISSKIGQAGAATHAALTEAERSEFVREYFADLAAVQGMEAQITAIYTDPTVNNPDETSVALRAERDAMRAGLAERQTIVEAILEGQVSAVLVDEGFGVGGQLFPPVWMRFTQQTMILVASPRDRIEMMHTYTTEPIPVDQRERIEAAVLAEEDLSAVIVPIGGMALYPAMIVESASIPWITETFAHEWVHHYLMFFPLGYETEFLRNPEARIINETTASVFGREISRKVLERYYPDLAPPPPTPRSIAPKPDTETETTVVVEEPHFDYGREMNITRVRTDQLLTKGRVEEAEAYMEARRALFVGQGYGIRVLNQAWFSFYGGYQVSGISAGGEDPIGPAVQQLRDEASGAKAWVETMRGITTRDALLAAT